MAATEFHTFRKFRRRKQCPLATRLCSLALGNWNTVLRDVSLACMNPLLFEPMPFFGRPDLPERRANTFSLLCCCWNKLKRKLITQNEMAGNRFLPYYFRSDALAATFRQWLHDIVRIRICTAGLRLDWITRSCSRRSILLLARYLA